jgi:hypothetical protein
VPAAVLIPYDGGGFDYHGGGDTIVDGGGTAAVMSYEVGGGGTICDGGGDNGDGDIISRRRR